MNYNSNILIGLDNELAVLYVDVCGSENVKRIIAINPLGKAGEVGSGVSSICICFDTFILGSSFHYVTAQN